MRGRPRGFSLGEVVFSMAMLALVLGGVLKLLPVSTVAIRRVECGFHAQSLAEAALEKSRAGGFSSLALGATSLPDQTLDGITYSTEVEIFSVPTVDPKFLKGLRSKISWQYRGKMYKVTRESWMSAVKS